MNTGHFHPENNHRDNCHPLTATQSHTSENSDITIRSLTGFMQDYPLENLPVIKKSKIINLINLLNFKEKSIWAHVKGLELRNDLLIKVFADPCLKGELVCNLAPHIQVNLEHFTFENILIENDGTAILIPVHNPLITPATLKSDLPEFGYILDQRKQKRFLAWNVSCEIVQEGITATGYLLDFCASGFRISLQAQHPGFDIAKPMQVSMHNQSALVFQGLCQSLRSEKDQSFDSLILTPLSTAQKTLFRKKHMRNPRQKLSPTPRIVFTHPFSGNMLSFEVHDITNAGFCIEEDAQHANLMPGLIIPKLSIQFNSLSDITCPARVAYALKKDDMTRYGFAILDLSAIDLYSMCSILDKASDINVSTNNLTDMDSLWEFFFNSGFIYPQKYAYLRKYKDAFRNTIEKLYQGPHGLIYHQLYQHRGIIYGHISCMRAYQRVWSIQHFMARAMPGNDKVGLEIYKNVFNMFDATYRYPSMKIDYILFYFRPSSTFNMYFQASFCKKMKNPKICSMDLFAYEIFKIDPKNSSLPAGWRIDEFGPEDLPKIKEFYEKHSGGLFLDAIGLGKKFPDEAPIEELYKQNNLIRYTKFHVLRHNETIKALFVTDVSDIGLNLSELLNCMKVLVPDPGSLPPETLQKAVNILGAVYQTKETPVLIYPSTYPATHGMQPGRSYYLWILDTKWGYPYTAYMKKKIQISPVHRLYRFVQKKLSHTEV